MLLKPARATRALMSNFTVLRHCPLAPSRDRWDRTRTQHPDITASPQHCRWTCRPNCLGMGAAFQHPCWHHQVRPAWYARITPVPARNEGERTSARPARSLRLLRIPGMCRKRSRTHPRRLRALHPRMLRGARLAAAGLSIRIDQQVEPRQAQGPRKQKPALTSLKSSPRLFDFHPFCHGCVFLFFVFGAFRYGGHHP
jgi:hypothetical protein